MIQSTKPAGRYILPRFHLRNPRRLRNLRRRSRIRSKRNSDYTRIRECLALGIRTGGFYQNAVENSFHSTGDLFSDERWTPKFGVRGSRCSPGAKVTHMAITDGGEHCSQPLGRDGDAPIALTYSKQKPMSGGRCIHTFGVTMRAADVLLLMLLVAAAMALSAASSTSVPQDGAPQTSTHTETNRSSEPQPRHLRWTLDRVEKRLRRAGIPVQRGTRITQPFMSIRATVLLAGAADEMEIQVYVYRSAAARNRDTSRLDQRHIAPPGVSPTWLMPPSLVVDGNLALIVLTRSEELRKKLAATFDPK